MRLLRLLLLPLAAWVLCAPLLAQDGFPPTPNVPVYDGANILTEEQEGVLNERLFDLPTQTGNSLIVATIPSLEGETIESYAYKLYETWGIGGASRDTGVLLLVAPNERRVRIEVGYGLTPVVTDILSGRIIREEITPRFKAGDLYGGIEAGVTALENQLSLAPEDAQAVAEAAQAAEAQRQADEGFPIGALIPILFILFFFVIPAIRGVRGGRRYRGSVAGDIGQVILWNAIANASRGHGRHSSGWGGGGSGGGGGFGGFGGGMSGGGGASGSW